MNVDPENLTRSSGSDSPHEATLLLAEDNNVNQFVIKKMLTKMNYKVDIANNGSEAVDMMQRKNYDLVFMDIEMPILSKYIVNFASCK